MRQTGRMRHALVPLFCFLLWESSLLPAEQQTGHIQITDRSVVLHQIDSLLERTYVLADRAAAFAAEFRALWRSGTYDTITDNKAFAAMVTGDLRRITRDQHMQLRVAEATPLDEPPLSPLHHPLRYHNLGIRENKGFSRLEWLEGNIGLLELRRFNYFPDARPLIVAGMTFLSNANAIIIDIRQNGGGSGDYLSSYFLPHPTQLTGSYARKENYLTEAWTTRDIGIAPMTEVPVFILIGRNTFSAAESFAYDMQVRKRATLVGEPTGGGAHSIDLFTLADAFELMISTERAVNPITGTNWEGIGVQPDILVQPAAAFDTALVLARKAGDSVAAVRNRHLKRFVGDMEYHLRAAEQCYRTGKRAAGSAALDSLFAQTREAGMLSEFFVLVLAYNYISSSDKAFQYALLKKNVELFPSSSFAFEVFAYTCFQNGDMAQSAALYRNVLALNPDNRNAEAMLRRIQAAK
jgi:retinol-binding protein 3